MLIDLHLGVHVRQVSSMVENHPKVRPAVHNFVHEAQLHDVSVEPHDQPTVRHQFQHWKALDRVNSGALAGGQTVKAKALQIGGV